MISRSLASSKPIAELSFGTKTRCAALDREWAGPTRRLAAPPTQGLGAGVQIAPHPVARVRVGHKGQNETAHLTAITPPANAPGPAM